MASEQDVAQKDHASKGTLFGVGLKRNQRNTNNCFGGSPPQKNETLPGASSSKGTTFLLYVLHPRSFGARGGGLLWGPGPHPERGEVLSGPGLPVTPPGRQNSHPPNKKVAACGSICLLFQVTFHLLKNIIYIYISFLVGFKGNLSLLEVFSFFLRA